MILQNRSVIEGMHGMPLPSSDGRNLMIGAAHRCLEKGAVSCVCLFILLCVMLSCCSDALAKADDFDSGMKLLKAKQFSSALSHFDRSVDAQPTNGEYHYWRGKCLSALGKVQDASAEFKLAALLSSDASMKALCKTELARFNKPLPKGSVNATLSYDGSNVVVASDETDPQQDGKFFKLSSKKLDWNLEMKKDFLNAMKSKNEQLGRLASGNGKRWRLPAAAAMTGPGLGIDIREALRDGPAHFNIPLSVEETRTLAGSDIVIILDHSGSMRTMDCPSASGGVEARLTWCTEELESFAETLSHALPHGFHLITFESKPDIYHINSAARMREVLQSLTGGGGTDLSAALREAFRIHSAHPKQPLLVAVVSDAEIDISTCERTIIEATRQFPLPNGIFITLLQVGIVAEVHTADRLNLLDNLRTRSGASYDAFTGIPFSKVRREGLGRDLLTGLRLNLGTTAKAK